MPACAFDNPDRLYSDYQSSCFSRDFSESESADYLEKYISAELNRPVLSTDTIPTISEFFTQCVFPLVAPIQRGDLVPVKLVKIGLSTAHKPHVLIPRLAYLIECFRLGEVSLEKEMKRQLYTALIDWARQSNTCRKLPATTPNMCLLVGLEALLFWHYHLLSTSSSNALLDQLKKLRKECLDELKIHRQHSNRKDLLAREPDLFNFAPGVMTETMKSLQQNDMSWLAVFSKCRSAFGRLAEQPATADTKLRQGFLNDLDGDRQSLLEDHESNRVKSGIDVFSQFANTAPEEALGRSPRGRHSHDRVTVQETIGRKLCMWGCPYRDHVRDAIPQHILSNVNQGLWGLFLTAVLVYPLGKSQAKLHRWLKTLDDRFDATMMGHVSVTSWHERLEKVRVPVFRELVPQVQHATLSVDPTWGSFWKKVGL